MHVRGQLGTYLYLWLLGECKIWASPTMSRTYGCCNMGVFVSSSPTISRTVPKILCVTCRFALAARQAAAVTCTGTAECRSNSPSWYHLLLDKHVHPSLYSSSSSLYEIYVRIGDHAGGRTSASLLTTAKSSSQPVCLTRIFHHSVTVSRHVNQVWCR